MLTCAKHFLPQGWGGKQGMGPCFGEEMMLVSKTGEFGTCRAMEIGC